jgi:hypothetical protein
VSYVVQLIVGGATGLVGALIGAGAALWVYRADRRARDRDELVAALQTFATSLDVVVGELRRNAPPRRWLRRASVAVDKTLPELGWLAGPLIEMLWPRTTAISDQLLVAVNRLIAVAPQHTLAEAEEAGKLIASWPGARDGEWDQQWTAYRNRLQQHIRDLAGAEQNGC